MSHASTNMVEFPSPSSQDLLSEVVEPHDQQSVRTGSFVHTAQDDVDRDAFVRGKAAQAVDSGQVDQFQCDRADLGYARMFFDRDARVIARRLP